MAQRPDTGDEFTAAPLPVAALDDAQRLACLRLIRSENVGPVSFRSLINHFGGATEALAALPDLARRGGRRSPIRICPRDVAEAELEAAARAALTPLFTIEPGYPRLLAHIEAPPPLLYTKGHQALLSAPSVAIVGSRDSSAAGQAFARQMAKALGEAGLTIVSGLARGIDGAAHRASLATGTVAVLAGGLDVVYPPEHASLQAEIAERGCLVGEQPPGFQPRGQDFPRRNRIIAGIGMAIVVIEAARRSGSLISARMAAEIGREVFAVPGHPLDPRAEGTNQLLKDGATMATSPADVLSVLEPQMNAPVWAGRELMEPAARPPTPPSPGPTPTAEGDQARLLGALGPAPVSIDELARATELSAQTVRGALLELNLAGRVELHGHQLVSLRTPGDGG